MKMNDRERECDFQASYATDDLKEIIASCIAELDNEAITLITVRDNNDDWIVDSSCSNHMVGDKDKLSNMFKYKGRRVVVTINNLKLSITYVGQTVIMSRFGSQQVQL